MSSAKFNLLKLRLKEKRHSTLSIQAQLSPHTGQVLQRQHSQANLALQRPPSRGAPQDSDDHHSGPDGDDSEERKQMPPPNRAASPALGPATPRTAGGRRRRPSYDAAAQSSAAAHAPETQSIPVAPPLLQRGFTAPRPAFNRRTSVSGLLNHDAPPPPRLGRTQTMSPSKRIGSPSPALLRQHSSSPGQRPASPTPALGSPALAATAAASSPSARPASPAVSADSDSLPPLPIAPRRGKLDSLDERKDDAGGANDASSAAATAAWNTPSLVPVPAIAAPPSTPAVAAPSRSHAHTNGVPGGHTQANGRWDHEANISALDLGTATTRHPAAANGRARAAGARISDASRPHSILDVDSPAHESHDGPSMFAPTHLGLGGRDYDRDHEDDDQMEDEEEVERIIERIRRRRAARSTCPWLMRHIPDRRAPFWNTQFRLVWDLVLAAITLYHFVTIPLRIGQYEHWTDPTSLQVGWAVPDYLFDALFVVDIMLRCFIFLPLDEECFGDDGGEVQEALHALDEDAEEDSLLAEAAAEADAQRAAQHTKAAAMNGAGAGGGGEVEMSRLHSVSVSGLYGHKVRRNKLAQTAADANTANVAAAGTAGSIVAGNVATAPASSSRKPAPKSKHLIFFIYVRSHFFWDLMASIPLDFLALLPGVGAVGIPFLRLNKLIRLKRFASFWSHFPDTVEHLVQLSPNVWRFVSMLLIFIFAAHWSACIWVYIGQSYLSCPLDLDSCFSLEANWLQFDGIETASFGTKYVRALYGMTSTLFTVGLGDIRPLATSETIFFGCVGALGAILCARATATFASMFSKMDHARVEYEQRLQNLKAYCKGKYLPRELQSRVLSYHEHVWRSSKGMDEKRVLEALPPHLRMEALVFLEGDAIRKVPFFSSASAGLINSIALVLQPSLFSPDSYIQVKGQVGAELYLVHKGECGKIVERADGAAADALRGSAEPAYTILHVYQSGSYFGELTLFRQHDNDAHHKHSIKSFTFLELFKLTRTDFERVMTLCCNNSEAEAAMEMEAMHKHQVSYLKSQEKVQKLLGSGDVGFGAEDRFDREMKRKWYYRLMLPSSWFRLLWAALSNLIIVYWLLCLPFRIAFMYTPFNMILNESGETNNTFDHGTGSQFVGGTPNDTLRFWLKLDGATDVFFLIDMLLKSRWFFFQRSFEEETARQERQKARELAASAAAGEGRLPNVMEEEESFNVDAPASAAAYSASSRALNTRPELIFHRYKRSQDLLWDALSSLPVDYLFGATLGWEWWSICRLIRLLRVYIVKSSYARFQAWLLQSLHVNPDAFRLLTYFFLYLAAVHWTACVWYGVGLISVSMGDDSWLKHERDPSTNLLEAPTADAATSNRLLLRNYVRSLYMIITTTTTTAGYKDVLAYSILESLIASLMMIFLVLIYYFALGCISVVLTQISHSEHSFQEKMDTLHTFIKQHMSPRAAADEAAAASKASPKSSPKLSPAAARKARQYTDGISPRLAATIKSYYGYLWFRQRGVKEEELLGELPTALREEVAVALNLDVLQSMTLFSGCSQPLLKAILSKFRYQIFLPDEYICRAHDVANEMFILNRGKAVVVSPNETVTFELLNRNTFYGEALFLMQLRRKASVKTIDFCDVSLLSTIDFQSAISGFPLERQRIFENSIAVRKWHVKSEHSLALNRKMAKVKQVMSHTFTAAVSKFVTFSPTSNFVRNWQIALMILSLYHCLMIPLRIAFVHVTPLWAFYLEYCLDVVYWADIYLKAQRFSFLKFNGHPCKEPSLIAVRYWKEGGMWFDLLASAPLDVVALALSKGTGDWMETMAYLRLPRVLRSARIPAYFARLREVVQAADLGLEINYLRLMELGVLCLLVCHWVGCVFYWLARIQGGVGAHPATNTWLSTFGISGASLTVQYLSSVYWALGTVSTVCYGDVTPHSIIEHVYVIVVALLCFFSVAALVGNIGSLLAHLDASAAELAHKLNKFDEYARRHGLPELLQYRVHQYWIHLHKLQQGVDEEALLLDMPHTLRTAVATARYVKYLQHQPYFAFCEPNLLQQLAEALKLEVFIPGDLIMCEGDLGRKFYIVKQGQIQIVKSGVGGMNQAQFIRRLAFGRGGNKSQKGSGRNSPARSAERGSPFLGGHRRRPTAMHGRANTNDGMLPISHIAQQLHQRNVSSNSGSSDPSTTATRHRRGSSVHRPQGGRVRLHGPRINTALAADAPGAAADRLAPNSPITPFQGARSGFSSRNFPSGLNNRSSGVSRAGHSHNASLSGVEMSTFSLADKRGPMDPRASQSLKSSQPGTAGFAASRKGSAASAKYLSAPHRGFNGRLAQHERGKLPLSMLVGSELPPGALRPDDDDAANADEDVVGELPAVPLSHDRHSPQPHGQAPASRAQFSLRDILGSSMLHHPSYAQDAIVLAGVGGGIVNDSSSSGGTGGSGTPLPQASPTLNGQASPRMSPQPSPPHGPSSAAGTRLPRESAEPSRTSSSNSSQLPSSGSNGSADTAHAVEDAPVILQLAEGSMLGELSFFLPLRRTASIYATTFCTFLVLDRKQFNECMSSLPHYVSKMRDIARRSVEEQAMMHANIRRNFSQHTTKLRKMCMVSASSAEKAKWGSEFQQRMAQRRREKKHRSWLPSSSFYQLWKLLIFLLLSYNLFVIPFRICYQQAFPSMTDVWFRWLIFDWSVDLLFLVDLYLNATRFAFMDETLGIGRMSRDEIWAHYRSQGNFKIDVMAAMPIDLLALAWTPANYSAEHRLGVFLLLRLSKMLRVAEIPSLVRSLAPTEVKLLRAFSRVGIGISEGGVRFFKMLLIFFLVAHLIGCLWFVVGYQSALGAAAAYSHHHLEELAAGPATTPAAAAGHAAPTYISWLHADKIFDQSVLESTGTLVIARSGSHIYVRALYFSVKSLVTLGVADLTATNVNVSELSFSILVIIVSAMTIASFVAIFESTLHNIDEDSAVFQRQMDGCTRFMRAKRLPQGLQDRIQLYYSYIWNRSKGVDESIALSTLSTQLRTEVLSHRNRDIIDKVSLFRDCDVGFIHSLAVVLQAAVFMPDDIIIRAGTISNSMYFVKSGSVVMERDGCVLMELSDGDFFGENHLLTARPSTANFIAQSFCDLFTLSRTHYEQVIEYYPKYRQLLIWKMNAINQQKRKQASDAANPEAVAEKAAAAARKERDLAISDAAAAVRNLASLPADSPSLHASSGSIVSSAVGPKRSVSSAHGFSLDKQARLAAPLSPHAMDIPSPTGPGGGEAFNRNRRGSFQQHRTELERKRAQLLSEYESTADADPAAVVDNTLATRVAIGLDQLKETASPTSPGSAKGRARSGSMHALSPISPPALTAHLTHVSPERHATSPILRIHAGRLDANVYMPTARRVLDVDVVVPSFRLQGGRGLPSPSAYRHSIQQMREFKDATSDAPQAALSPPPIEPHHLRAEEPLSPHKRSPRLSPHVGFISPPDGRASSSVPPELHLHPLPAIVFTPLPRSPPISPKGSPCPTPRSRHSSGSSHQQRVTPMPTPRLPLIRTLPMLRSSSSSSAASAGEPSPSIPELSPDEPSTLTFHLPTPRVLSPAPRSADSALHPSGSGSSAFRPLAVSPASPRSSGFGAMAWPPADLDIDDSIREELARMGYVGLTAAQRASRPSSPSPAVATPVGATPLSPLLSTWRSVSGVLPERLQFPSNSVRVHEAQVEHVAIDIAPEPKHSAMAAVDLRVAELQSANPSAEPVRFKIHPRPTARSMLRPPPSSSSRPTHVRGGLSTVMSIDLPAHEVDEMMHTQILPSPPSAAMDSAYWQSSPIGDTASPSLETIEREITAASKAASAQAVAAAALPPLGALPTRSSSLPSEADLERVANLRTLAPAVAVDATTSADAVSAAPADTAAAASLLCGAARPSLHRTASAPTVAARYRRPRSKSHDLTHGAEHDLQRLLLSTARKVAQHLRQPIAPPRLDAHAVERAKQKQQAQAAAEHAAKTAGASLALKRGSSTAHRRNLHGGLGACVVSFAPPVSPPSAAASSCLHVAPVPVPVAHGPRRHSFNAAMFRSGKLDEVQAEQTFKSVFDF